jgi:hypothetical protein
MLLYSREILNGWLLFFYPLNRHTAIETHTDMILENLFVNGLDKFLF